MMRWLYRRLVDRGEQEIGQSADWLRDVLASSPAGFRKFALFLPLSRHRAHAGAAPWHLARLAATLAEDCGPCSQIAVDLALKDGVSPEVLRAGLAGRLDSLDPVEAAAFRFGDTVARNDPAAEDCRLALEALAGRAAMADFAVAVATARVFPAMKRGLGHALSCARVAVEVRP